MQGPKHALTYLVDHPDPKVSVSHGDRRDEKLICHCLDRDAVIVLVISILVIGALLLALIMR